MVSTTSVFVSDEAVPVPSEAKPTMLAFGIRVTNDPEDDLSVSSSKAEPGVSRADRPCESLAGKIKPCVSVAGEIQPCESSDGEIHPM